MINLSDLPLPAKEALAVYIKMRAEDLHFFESAVRGLRGMVNSRRDRKQRHGTIYYKNYIAADLLEDFEELIRTLKEHIPIGDYFVDRESPLS